MKLFQFHIKWTLDLSSGKTVVIDTKILETWNVGKLSEKIIAGLDHPNKDEFERSDIKAEVMENNEVIYPSRIFYSFFIILKDFLSRILGTCYARFGRYGSHIRKFGGTT